MAERNVGLVNLLRIERLKEGTPAQQAAWRVLTELGILDLLSPFDARLAGTIPIDVDIPGSDLDVICQADDLNALARVLATHYGHHTGFQMKRKVRYGHPVLVCEFAYNQLPIQVYGSPTPVAQQRAWVHMVAEAYLLSQSGPEAKAAVRALKSSGMKTEPAFAHVFGLQGEPYEVLYELGLSILHQMESPRDGLR